MLKYFLLLQCILNSVLSHSHRYHYEELFANVYILSNNSIYVRDHFSYHLVQTTDSLRVIGLDDAPKINISVEFFRNMTLGKPVCQIDLNFDNKVSDIESPIKLSISSKSVLEVHNLHVNENNAAFAYFQIEVVMCLRHRSYSINMALTSDTLSCDGFERFQKKNRSDFRTLINPRTQIPIYGEDPRILPQKDSILMIFNYGNISRWPSRRIAAVSIKAVDETYYASSDTSYYMSQVAPYKDQKNWMPFFYHGKLFFVYSMFPHHILYPFHDTVDGQRRHGEEHAVVAESVAVTAMTNFTWPYGELRGGTPALLLGDVYLAFFHSSRRGAKTKRTYFMGAYTFSSAPPFQILSISQEPIVAKQFYQGKFSSVANDFVVFPTSFLYDKYRVYLYVGKQDTETWMMVLNRSALLTSLVPVRNVVVGNSKWSSDGVAVRNSFHYTTC